MKTFRLFPFTLALALAAGGLAPTALRAQDDNQAPVDQTAVDEGPVGQAPAPADGSPSFDYFYDQLQPYGQWVQVDGLGYCWQPANVDQNWQPYTDGYWAYTDAGWTWVSYEDFGWITYHYGRWTQVEDAGWVWVPGYQWGPAWVSWRHSQDDDLIGWAPLPPAARFLRGIGISIWVDRDCDIGPGYYSFCHTRDFGAPVLGPVIIDRSQNITFINQTVNITNITVSNNNIFNGGPNFRAISRHVDPARPIRALQLVRQANGGKGFHSETRGNQLIVAAPKIVAPTKPFTPPSAVKTISQPKFDKGWSKYNPQQVQQAHTAIQTQTKGIKPQRPATAIQAQQLAVVPKGPAPTPAPKGPQAANPAVQQPNTAVQPTPTPKGKFRKGAPTPPPVNNPAAQQQVATPTQPTTPAAPTPTPVNKRRKGAPTPPVNPAVNPAVQQPVHPVQPTPPPQNNAALLKQQQLQQQQSAAAAAKQKQLQQQQATGAAAHQQQLQQQQAAAAAAKQQQVAAARQQQLQQQQAAAAAARQQQATAAAAAAAHKVKPTPTPVP